MGARYVGPMARRGAPLLAPLAAVVLLAGCVPSVYDAPYPVAPVRLPRDDAAHAAPVGQQFGKTFGQPAAQVFGRNFFLPGLVHL